MKTTMMMFHTAGGRVPFTLLRRTAELALVHGNGTVGLGGRQELILTGIPATGRDAVREAIGTLLPEHHPRRPNIVTTRAATGRSHRTPWLSEGAYDHVLESFTSPPAIPVHLADPHQPYVPLFTGQLHFVASREREYWHVSFNTTEQAPPTRLAGAVHSADIPAVSRLIQGALAWSGGPELPRLQALMERQFGSRLRELAFPSLRTGDSRPLNGFVLDRASETYSLAIPAFSAGLPGQFLVDLAVLLRSTDLGTAHLTTWKSLIVHQIPRDIRGAIERLLLQHRVNLSPGAWDLVCFNDLRRGSGSAAIETLVRGLNRAYPHPGDLRIGAVEHGTCLPDMPIVVRTAWRRRGLWPSQRPRFSIFVREGYDAHNPVLRCKASDIRASALADAMYPIIETYLRGEKTSRKVVAEGPPAVPAVPLYRCRECGTEYNFLYGDPLGKIEPGTPFEELPAHWHCPTCEAPQDSFRPFHGVAA